MEQYLLNMEAEKPTHISRNINKLPPPKIHILNATSEGIAPTILAHYAKEGLANYMHSDGRRAIAIIEIYDEQADNPT